MNLQIKPLPLAVLYALAEMAVGKEARWLLQPQYHAFTGLRLVQR